jgi:hypothetical protein
MFKKIKLALALNRAYNQLEAMSKMKFTSNLQMFLHILTIAAGLGVSISPLLPDRQKIYVLAVTGAIQAFLGKLGTTRNTDGTPQELAFVAPTTADYKAEARADAAATKAATRANVAKP